MLTASDEQFERSRGLASACSRRAFTTRKEAQMSCETFTNCSED